MSTIKNIIVWISSFCRTKKIEDSSDPNITINKNDTNEQSSSFEMKAKQEASKVNKTYFKKFLKYILKLFQTDQVNNPTIDIYSVENQKLTYRVIFELYC